LAAAHCPQSVDVVLALQQVPEPGRPRRRKGVVDGHRPPQTDDVGRRVVTADAPPAVVLRPGSLQLGDRSLALLKDAHHSALLPRNAEFRLRQGAIGNESYGSVV